METRRHVLSRMCAQRLKAHTVHCLLLRFSLQPDVCFRAVADSRDGRSLCKHSVRVIQCRRLLSGSAAPNGDGAGGRRRRGRWSSRRRRRWRKRARGRLPGDGDERLIKAAEA